jgi:hypothetical protein
MKIVLANSKTRLTLNESSQSTRRENRIRQHYPELVKARKVPFRRRSKGRRCGGRAEECLPIPVDSLKLIRKPMIQGKENKAEKKVNETNETMGME